MIDRKDPEIQRYLEEELQKQKEMIVVRIIWQNLTKPHFIGPTQEDVKYATGLSKEEIRKIVAKYCRKLGYTSVGQKESNSIFGKPGAEVEEPNNAATNIENDTVDKKNPEIKEYVDEELKKQKERIAERLIWLDMWKSLLTSLSNEDIAYWVDLSEEEIEKIDKKCRWKLRYKVRCEQDRLIEKVERFRQMLKNAASDDAIKEEFVDTHIDPEILKAWRKNPDKYAVMELASRVSLKSDFLDGLHIREDEFLTLYPTDAELHAYHPVFKTEKVSDEELEEAYQKEEREQV